MRIIWNTLTYLSPVLLSTLIYFFTSIPEKVDYSDSNFTMEWAIATMAAGFILSNLPAHNSWVEKIKTLPGVFKRLSLFLMSPTIYGLFHYSLNQIKDKDSELISCLLFITYISTILSIALTVMMLVIIIYKIHDQAK